MKKILNFNQFDEKLNEGLISWMKSKISPKEMNDSIEDIIDYIKKNFDPTKLIKTGHLDQIYEYTTDKNDVITVGPSSFTFLINNEDIGNHVSEYYVEKLYNFFDKNYISPIEIDRKRDISKMKSNLQKYKKLDNNYPYQMR